MAKPALTPVLQVRLHSALTVVLRHPGVRSLWQLAIVSALFGWKGKEAASGVLMWRCIPSSGGCAGYTGPNTDDYENHILG
jgi:hypothetical protein